MLSCSYVKYCCFFFSSRRRHTRSLRDWSSDVCSSGLGNGLAADKWKEAGIQGWYFAHREEPIASTISRLAALPMDAHPGEKRSEERRVGKECRSRWTLNH